MCPRYRLTIHKKHPLLAHAHLAPGCPSPAPTLQKLGRQRAAGLRNR
ncbi:unnamed protein product [Staurois parvus]|uniref:Uncharacterized protein n=1 Tax=Staurois parvus TaxID=386267 RepID=A0ABN9BC62_9NEOB|nr:unnamed protein product [Staurois parvus]